MRFFTEDINYELHFKKNVLVVVLLVNNPFISCCKFESPYLRKITAAARAALPIPISVSSIFVCPNNSMAASVWDF